MNHLNQEWFYLVCRRSRLTKVEVSTPSLQDVGGGWQLIDGLQNSFTTSAERTVMVTGIANAESSSGQDTIELRLLVDGVPGQVIQAGTTSYGQELQYDGEGSGSSLSTANGPVGIVSAGFGSEWNLLPESIVFSSTAAAFSGGVLSVPDTNTLSIPGAGPFTIEAWVRPNSYTGSFQTIARKWDSNAGQNEYALGLIASGQLQFQNATGGSVTTGPSVPLNTWSHVAVVVNGGSAELYINGAAQGGGGVGSFRNTFAPFEIGADQGTPNTFASSAEFVGANCRVFRAFLANACVVDDSSRGHSG